MFSLYGTTGRLFLGSMEQLRHIDGVQPVARTRAIQPLGRDGRDAASREGGPGGYAGPSDELHRSALAAYAQTQHPASPRQVLHRVADLMSHSVITVPASSTVLQAWQLLAQHGVGQAPVLGASGGLVGLLSRAELLQPARLPLPEANAVAWRSLLAQSVQTVMWTPVPSVAPDTDIRQLAQVLLDTGLPGLPVVDGQGSLVGFVSRSDILRAMVSDPPLDLWG